MTNIEKMSSISRIEALYKINNSGERFLMHVHNNYEIYVSLSNNNKFFIGHRIYDVNRYDVFLFNNTDVHKINTFDPDNYERYVVMFSPQLFPKSDPELHELLGCFDTSQQNRSHKLSLLPESRQEFLSILQKMIDCEHGVSHQFLKQRLYLIQLLLLLKDIRRMFKAKMGFGISNYIESCRLSNAIPLLREGLPVSTVALKTGFGNDTYFISTFKKNLGFSPKKYLKQG